MRTLPLIVSLPILAAITGVGHAETAKQEVSVSFALKAGKEPVDCSHDIKGLGLNKVNAKLRDARVYISEPALIDEAGKAVPIELIESDWQYANVALLDFVDRSGVCVGTASVNDSIKGVVPVGSYRGFSFVVGVPSVIKAADGKDIILNHSNFATAPAPLDIQAMAWNWQAGRKFMKVEIQPEGGVTREPMKPKPAKAEGEGGSMTEAEKAEAGAAEARRAQAAKAELVATNADGTITVKTWMLHFGSSGCKGDPLTGEIVSCASGNRFAVSFDSFDPAKQQLVFDLAALLANIDINHDRGGATGCMSGPADPECALLWERIALNIKETAPDANDAGKPTPGAQQQLFRVEMKKPVRESKN